MNKELKEIIISKAQDFAYKRHPRTCPQMKAGPGYGSCVKDYIAGATSALSPEVLIKVPEVRALVDTLTRLHEDTMEDLVIQDICIQSALAPWTDLEGT